MMGKKLISKTAKVLSETKKNKDKVSVAVAYEHIPRNPEEQNHGSLYAVIELSDSAGHAEEIAESIIDALYNEYYIDTTRDTLSSFEAALAKVNEELAERSSEGQINWLGKLNAILGVLTGSKLHLSQAGKAEAFLYRAGHTMHITEDLSGDSINPLRTFINVASGDLAENDKLAFVTPGVFLKMSKAELKKYVETDSPRNAVESISQILSGESTNVPNAVLIMEMLSPEAFASDPEPEINPEAWVKEEHKPLEKVSEQTIKGTAKAFDILGKVAGGAGAFISTKIAPVFKTGSTKIMDKINSFRKVENAERIILEDEEPTLETNEPENLETLEHDNDEVEKITVEPKAQSVTGINEFRIREKEEKPKLLGLERFDFTFATKLKDRLFGATKGIRLRGGGKRNYFLIAGVAAGILLVVFLAITNNNNKQKTEAQNKFDQAKEKYEEAVGQISTGQKTAATETLEIAQKLAKEVESSKYNIEGTEKLLADIENLKNQALGIFKDTAVEFFDFGKDELNSIFTDGKLIYAVRNSNGSVYALDPKSKSIATITENAKLDSPVKLSAFVANRKVIVLFTEKKSLYEVDTTTKRVTKQAVTGTIEDTVAIATYNSNLYTLSPENSQIYRRLKISGGYSTKTRYFSDTDSLSSDALDLMIDSSVYVLQRGGVAQKYTSGQKQSFSIKNLPTNIGEVSHIYGGPTVEGLYMFSENKIVKVDQNQNYVGQYTNSKIKNIQSLYVDDELNTIFVLSEGKVFSIQY